VAHQASKSCSLRCTNAHAPGAGGVSPPWLAEPHRQGSATFAMYERTCTRSGGRQPPVARGTARARECDFCDARTRVHVSPPWLAVTHVQRRSHQCRCDCRRASADSAQSRCYILDNIHGGLTRGDLVSGEPPPACAWRFSLHARSPHHGGLTRRSCVGRIAACLCVAISFARAFS
jgi:hypothetical protein